MAKCVSAKRSQEYQYWYTSFLCGLYAAALMIVKSVEENWEVEVSRESRLIQIFLRFVRQVRM